jgi:hypothetical protein
MFVISCYSNLINANLFWFLIFEETYLNYTSKKIRKMAFPDPKAEKKLRHFIDAEVETLRPPTTAAFIFRVPDELRNGNGPFFEPKTIPIGPLHAEKPSMVAAREMKKWYLKAFLSRLPQVQKSKDQLVELLTSLESNTRGCYKDIPGNLSNYEFLEIMLLDGCFIVELLLRHNWRQVSHESVLGKEEKVPLYTLQQDLLKVENQIPFFVLHALSQLQSSNPDSDDRILIDATLNFFGILKPQEMTYDRPRQILELVMFALFPRLPQSSHTTIPALEKSHQSTLSKARSASELELYGIRFKARETTNLADFKFSKGVFGIPRLEIQESTTALFWNILMFEMCSCEHRLFASYAVLMDTLVNNEKDVEVLLRSGVVKNRINDVQKVVSLFNDLSANLQQKEFYFDRQINQVNQYCEPKHRHLRAYCWEGSK